MTQSEFERIYEEFTRAEQGLLAWKRRQYSSEADCLFNFRQAGAVVDLDPKEVCLVYLVKHIGSIANAVRDESYTWAWETEDGEAIKQRIADARNYLLLLAACIEEDEL